MNDQGRPASAPASALGWDIAPWLCVAALAVAWEGVARSGMVTPFMLPPLSVVLERIGSDAVSGELFLHLGLTLYRALAGFLIAAASGVVLDDVFAGVWACALTWAAVWLRAKFFAP